MWSSPLVADKYPIWKTCAPTKSNLQKPRCFWRQCCVIMHALIWDIKRRLKLVTRVRRLETFSKVLALCTLWLVNENTIANWKPKTISGAEFKLFLWLSFPWYCKVNVPCWHTPKWIRLFVNTKNTNSVIKRYYYRKFIWTKTVYLAIVSLKGWMNRMQLYIYMFHAGTRLNKYDFGYPKIYFKIPITELFS